MIPYLPLKKNGINAFVSNIDVLKTFLWPKEYNELYSSMKITLIGSLFTVSVPSAVKIDLCFRMSYGNAIFMMSFPSISSLFFPLTFLFFAVFSPTLLHLETFCHVIIYFYFGMISFIFSGKWTTQSLKMPIIWASSKRSLLGMSVEEHKNKLRKRWASTYPP